jgi:hypothetical protein
MWEISWRTARLGAHETYMDTAYWEQLQYVGDTRIQALISYAIAGDDRMAKQALESFNESRIPAGVTQSRHPTSQPQIIPTSLLLYPLNRLFHNSSYLLKGHLSNTQPFLVRQISGRMAPCWRGSCMFSLYHYYRSDL